VLIDRIHLYHSSLTLTNYLFPLLIIQLNLYLTLESLWNILHFLLWQSHHFSGGLQRRIMKYSTNLLIQTCNYSISYSINTLSLDNPQAIMTNKEGISWKLMIGTGELALDTKPAALSPAGYCLHRTCQASLWGYCVFIYKLLV
jgi:hypothetical protein